MRIGRNSDHANFGRALAALVVSFAALLALAAQAQGARMDYGDAPDGADARYSASVAAAFPSLKASNGPRHRSSGPSLGVRRDLEPDSRQVDADHFDDGVSLVGLRRCGTSRITVVIDTRRIPAKLLRKRDLYLNSWFDWDRSGSWGEVNGCAGDPLLNNEWAIVNQRISGKAFLGDRVRALAFTFKGGRYTGELWMRATLTLGEELPIDAASRSGGARATPYAFGETEDYLRAARPGTPPVFDNDGKLKKNERLKLKLKEEEERREAEELKRKEEQEEKIREAEEWEEFFSMFWAGCSPEPLTIVHGRRGVVSFSIWDWGVNRNFVFGSMLTAKVGGGNKVKLIPSRNQRGVPPGFFRASGFSFKSPIKNRDARPNPVERHVIAFIFRRGKVVRTVRCVVNVIHDRIVEPKGRHKPVRVPPAEPKAEPKPEPQPQPQPPAVQGQGTYATNPIDTELVALSLQSTQNVEGVRVKLADELPSQIMDVENASPGLSCEVAGDRRSASCTGNIQANIPVGLSLRLMPPPGPGELDGRLELYLIQGGQDKGPFPIQPLASILT